MKGTVSRDFIVFLPILTVRWYFLVRYFFVKSIKIGPLISHIFRITNHRSLFLLKTSIYIHNYSMGIDPSIIDLHYRFAHHCKTYDIKVPAGTGRYSIMAIKFLLSSRYCIFKWFNRNFVHMNLIQILT